MEKGLGFPELRASIVALLRRSSVKGTHSDLADDW